MTRDEAAQMKVAEECMEVAHRIFKALRFGMDEVQPGQTLNNQERIEDELYDLAAALSEAKLEPENFDTARLEAKRERIKKYLDISIERGRVTA